MVKKENFSAYFKGKNFYISLLVGVCAVVAIAAVYVSVTTDNNKDLVDLNEPLTEIADERADMNKVTEDTDAIQEAQNANDSLLENDVVVDEKVLQEAISKTVADENKSDSGKAADNSKPDAVAVMNPGGTPNLKFNEEKGLLWPIKDNPDVIMKYSMDKGILFQTLAQYKCNPAIIIASKVGEDVLSAADGIITEISNNEETGLTLTMSIGNDYNLTFGQLKDCTVDVGDVVKEGDIIGKVADPTKYYIVEGSNLYFQVTEKGETVDPLLLLR
ncbi:murein DD-endopeptidase MepM/ murein hydrolase activator NlpD [Mobilisporobacter senegalensis]|uniref:Murein DD-endopeptidase MepM/ murein hydrolase activator NlpD n=1 Tax=Mobilisporobacter senegalensis TaxID=1329262 RepID=A0A3N1XL01_9FIRM|nr:murein DD-endopeptidase MepM/ murein hydrolase activator NlpD [Mobilisporobacter senegalensis]